ncbi:LUD domain-containing protein [Streptomyces blattellae]|uniref:LUD domain-containing protein n=1 Tax=Streptomyces blattellae TaxID=2569855 RepID=UPI0018ACCBDE|nr:LUD domain-containing protein [Streptomyces blattellae]
MPMPESAPAHEDHRGAAGDHDLESVAAGCARRGFNPEVVADREEALQRIHELIPAGSDVTNGSSVTLHEIGLMAELESSRRWRWRRAEIYATKEPEKRVELRRWATTADYMVGSVNALAATGEAVCLDAGGTRVGGYAYGAGQVIWVVGRNKITPTLTEAIERVRTHVFPLEDQRMRRDMGQPAFAGKLLVVEHEPLPDRIKLILVDEDLGY